MDPGDFLMEIAAGEGSQYLESGYGNPGLADLSMTYRLSDAFKDVLRIVHNQDVVHALWVESEPNLGLSVRKKERKPPNDDQPHQRWGSGSLDQSYSSSASGGTHSLPHYRLIVYVSDPFVKSSVLKVK